MSNAVLLIGGCDNMASWQTASIVFSIVIVVGVTLIVLGVIALALWLETKDLTGGGN